MNDGTKRKVPAAFLLRGTFGEPSGYIQYPPQWLQSQYSHQRSSRFIRAVSTFLIRAGRSLPLWRAPGGRRRGGHGDTPRAPQGPRLASRDAPGCRVELPAQPHAPPQKSETAGSGFPAASVVIWSLRPMASVVRVCVLVNSSAPARPSVRGRESGRG